MANSYKYMNGQVVYSNNETALFDPPAVVTDFSRKPNSGEGLDYQQIVITTQNKEAFVFNTSYYIKLTMPRALNFNFDYGLRLLKLKNEPWDLDDISDYQLIKYITVPKINTTATNRDRVAIYQTGRIVSEEIEWDTINRGDKWVDNIQVGIVLETDLETAGQYQPDYLANKIIYYNNNYYIYDENEETNFKQLNIMGAAFGKNDVILVHSWKNEVTDENKSTFEFIITPLGDNENDSRYDAIYLCLIPDESVDRDIQWTREGEEATYYGRYISNPENHITAQIYELNPVLEGDSSKIYTNIGIWGRPELMLIINGAEVKIGPSGYFELKDYDINSLCIAAFNAEDKYTVDYQYKQIIE